MLVWLAAVHKTTVSEHIRLRDIAIRTTEFRKERDHQLLPNVHWFGIVSLDVKNVLF